MNMNDAVHISSLSAKHEYKLLRTPGNLGLLDHSSEYPTRSSRPRKV